jgi:LAO/AO transport system kinase
MTVLKRFHKGDIRALSRVISFVENREEGYRSLLAKLYPDAGKAVRIGITGPPGAGKSTLINALATQLLAQGKKVGIVAVDPTSPFTGGALLGDRVRMSDFKSTDDIYFRSMATRGATGGLAGATDNVALVMGAFGFDVVIIETVGVGQIELDIIDSCDTVVVVVVPESGDSVQTMKAGLMEIADIFVVNKADRPGSERIVSELKSAMELRSGEAHGKEIPILATEAANNVGIDALVERLAAHESSIRASGQFDRHRREQITQKILNILRNRFQREFLESLAGDVALADGVDAICNGEGNPYDLSEALYERFVANTEMQKPV